MYELHWVLVCKKTWKKRFWRKFSYYSRILQQIIFCVILSKKSEISSKMFILERYIKKSRFSDISKKVSRDLFPIEGYLSYKDVRHGVGKPWCCTLSSCAPPSMCTHQAHYRHTSGTPVKLDEAEILCMCLMCATCVHVPHVCL